MISNENVFHLCSLFSKFTENENDVIASAEEEVEQLIAEDVIEFIKNCAAIIMNDEIEKNIIFFAFLSITRALSPQSVSIDVISSRWMDVDQEIREFVKEAVFRGILFEEENITNISSKTICILAIIEKEDFYPVIDQLLCLISEENTEDDQEQQDRFALSALYVLNEILPPPYYANYIKNRNFPNLKDKIQQMNASLFDIFANQAPSRSDKYKEMIISALNSFILYYSALYQDMAVIQLVIPIIQQYLMSDPSDDIYDLLCQMLYNLIIINYNLKGFEFAVINELIVDLVLKQENPTQFISSINIINYLSKYEFDILQKDIKYLKLLTTQINFDWKQASFLKFPYPEAFLNYVRAIPYELLCKLLFTFTLIDENDISAEQKEIQNEPHIYSASCLSNIFKLNHRFVFESVNDFWSDIYKKYYTGENGSSYNLLFDEKIPWTEKHALLLSIPVICAKMGNDKYCTSKYYSKNIGDDIKDLLHNFDYDENIRDDIISFLTDEIFSPNFRIFYDFILQAVYSPIPRIVDTALHAIKMCVQCYQIGIEIEDPETAPFTFLMEAFKKIMSETAYNEVIFKRILYVLSMYFLAFYEYKDYSLIMNYKEDIFAILSFGLSAPQNSYDIYILTNKAIGNLIRYTPNDCLIILSQILDNSMSTLIELMSFDFDDMTIIKIQQTLNIIMDIFKRREFNIPNEKLIEASEIIFDIMGQKNSVFEDALTCLIIIIKKLRNGSESIIDIVLSFVPVALSSQSPSIIQMIARALSYLFKENLQDQLIQNQNIKVLPQSLLEVLPNSIELITSRLTDESYTSDFYAHLLYSLATLIKSAKYCDFLDLMKIEEIKEIYMNFIPYASSLLRDNEIVAVNDMYESIFEGLSAILDVYKCFDQETQNELNNKNKIREFIRCADNYTNMEEFSDGSLESFCNFLHSFNVFFQRRSNSMLNKSSNFRPLCYAHISANEKIVKISNIMVDEMKKA